jgi:hypothetical protein
VSIFGIFIKFLSITPVPILAGNYLFWSHMSI